MAHRPKNLNGPWLYFAASVAAAAGIGLLLWGYWLAQVVLMMALALGVAVDSLRRTSLEESLEEDQPVARSRILHYARIARSGDSARFLETAGNSFEEEMLKVRGWTGLSTEELRELAKRLPMDEKAAVPASEPVLR